MNFYKRSISKLHEKMRNSKSDDKFKETLLNSIEKENAITIEIIRYIKNQYLELLETYCKTYQAS